MEKKEAVDVLKETIVLINEMYLLLKDLRDSTPCCFDHHGNCKAHGWYGNGVCPQERIRKLLDE
jgi:hypothetical protein